MTYSELNVSLSLIQKLKEGQVEYRGEGNTSLAISLIDVNKIIKLTKIKIKINKENFLDLERLRKKLFNDIDYIEHVLRKLFKPGIWFDPIRLIFINNDEIKLINQIVEPARENYRKTKVVPNNDCFGLLMNDYCNFTNVQLDHLKSISPEIQLVGSVLSIEIKPKQGFFPIEFQELGVCKYCLKQLYKQKKGLIQNVNKYCPFDLFSGNLPRMSYAIKCLIENPQNNLRLFVNLKQINFENNSNNLLNTLEVNNLDQETLIQIICNALIHSFDLSNHNDNLKNNLQLDDYNANQTVQICKYHSTIHNQTKVSNNLNNSILNSVLNLQKMDKIGSFEAYNIYQNLKFKNETDFEQYINEINNSVNLKIKNLHEKDCLLKQQLKDYLFASTAKDCSILITIQKLNKNLKHCSPKLHKFRYCIFSIDSKKTSYLFTVALIDLDRKKACKIIENYHKDHELVQNFSTLKKL